MDFATLNPHSQKPYLIQQLKSAQNTCEFGHILEGTAILLVLYSILIAIGAALH